MPDTSAIQDSVRVVRAARPRVLHAIALSGNQPVIDGQLGDAVWCDAPADSDFVQSSPNPGALATLPALVRVMYDDEAVYVAVRLFDPSPDSVLAPYPRRDDETTSDWVFVEVDTRFDRRSGYSFGLNPRGVQVDGTWANDVDYDAAWNGVWSGAARIDSAGWAAEYRIPWSQVALGRSAVGAPLTWGINVYRYTPHRGESDNWSPRLPTVVGVVSHFNQLQGLTVPPHSGSLELVPYGAASGTRSPTGTVQDATGGGDLRFRPTPSTFVGLSIHPDFGQVEADPSQVNLTTFEIFFPEQRPLFLEGADIFQFNSQLSFASRGTSFDQESPFYSRRIGRPPHRSVPDAALNAEVPQATTLLGAGRFSARVGEWSGGLFSAVTDEEDARYVDPIGVHHTLSVEPLTSFTVARTTREFRGGASAIGVMGTFIDRLNMTPGLDSLLPSSALVLGSDFRHRFAGDRYELSGFALGSRLEGSPEAIEAIRLDPRHGYGRPDLTKPDDSRTRHTSLTGGSAQGRIARVDGSLLWDLEGRVVTPGFEMNDQGFQRNANWLLLAGTWRYRVYRPGQTIRRWSIGSNQLGLGWTFDGEQRAAIANLAGSVDFRNYWGVSLSLDHEFPVTDPEVLRGGPALPLPARNRITATGYTDSRKRWQITVTASGEQESRSESLVGSLLLDFSGFVTDRLQLGLSPYVASAREGWQYVDQPIDGSGVRRYFLGRLEQTTTSLTARMTYAFSPKLTLQLYTQAFLSGGAYDRFKEVVAKQVREIAPSRIIHDVQAGQYIVDQGTATTATFSEPAFSERDLNLNFVMRWEFLPGSTLYCVWTRRGNDPTTQPFKLHQDLKRLWNAPTSDVLLVKISYWIAT
jgi:uncharacterized protein DUF5916/cellulose/xylan binding protein with CBM9 domain